MRYYPINLDIRDRNCLVVGGGSVGARKALSLLRCGGRVTVVSPEVTGALAALAEKGDIIWKRRGYETLDLESMFLVIGATDDQELNLRIFRDAEAKNLLCNIVDRPDVCNFILPALVSRGDLVIAVSTSGSSPALAKKIRKDLETQFFGEEYAVFLRLMRSLRKNLLRAGRDPETHKRIFEELISKGLLDRVRGGDRENIEGLLREVLGEDFRIESLMDMEGEPLFSVRGKI